MPNYVHTCIFAYQRKTSHRFIIANRRGLHFLVDTHGRDIFALEGADQLPVGLELTGHHGPLPIQRLLVDKLVPFQCDHGLRGGQKRQYFTRYINKYPSVNLFTSHFLPSAVSSTNFSPSLKSIWKFLKVEKVFWVQLPFPLSTYSNWFLILEAMVRFTTPTPKHTSQTMQN